MYDEPVADPEFPKWGGTPTYCKMVGKTSAILSVFRLVGLQMYRCIAFRHVDQPRTSGFRPFVRRPFCTETRMSDSFQFSESCGVSHVKELFHHKQKIPTNGPLQFPPTLQNKTISVKFVQLADPIVILKHLVLTLVSMSNNVVHQKLNS